MNDGESSVKRRGEKCAEIEARARSVGERVLYLPKVENLLGKTNALLRRAFPRTKLNVLSSAGANMYSSYLSLLSLDIAARRLFGALVLVT